MATTTQTFDGEQYASKLDEIGNKLPNLVGDQNALVAYAAELKGLAQRVRNPEDVKANPAGQPDVRPAYRDLHGDGQDEAMRPKYRLKHDENAPQHLPIAETNAATAAVYAENQRAGFPGQVAYPASPSDFYPGQGSQLLGDKPTAKAPFVTPTFRAGVTHLAETYEPLPPDYTTQTNTAQSVTDNTKYGTGTDTQKGPGNPGKL